MRAMLLNGPKPAEESPLVPGDVPIPEPGPGQVRLRVRACGVCHTELHTVEGELALPRLPLIPGHQVVGEVEAFGPPDDKPGLSEKPGLSSGLEGNGGKPGLSEEPGLTPKPGDRVGVGWLGCACGACELCRAGLENLCPNARFTGLHQDGGYAEHMVADARFVYGLPPHLTDVEAAPLLCAGIIGYRSLKLSGIQPGGRLGLYGFGASAHLVLQVARYRGCRVYVFTRGAAHRRLAEAVGAVWTGSAEEQPPEPLDAGITFAPAGRLVPLALAHLRPGGTLAINAVHLSPLPEMPYHLLYGERVLRSVANYTRADALESLRLAEEMSLRPTVEVWPLAQANAVLARLKRGEVQGSAVLRIAG